MRIGLAVIVVVLGGCWSEMKPDPERPLTPWPGESPDRTSACFTRLLRLTDEPPLGEVPGESYRVTYESEFIGYEVHTVRLTRSGAETLLVRRDAGHGERMSSRYLPASRSEKLIAHFTATTTQPWGESRGGDDGHFLSFEAYVDGHYSCIRRWSPDETNDHAFWALGNDFFQTAGVIGF